VCLCAQTCYRSVLQAVLEYSPRFPPHNQCQDADIHFNRIPYPKISFALPRHRYMEPAAEGHIRHPWHRYHSTCRICRHGPGSRGISQPIRIALGWLFRWDSMRSRGCVELTVAEVCFARVPASIPRMLCIVCAGVPVNPAYELGLTVTRNLKNGRFPVSWNRGLDECRDEINLMVCSSHPVRAYIV